MMFDKDNTNFNGECLCTSCCHSAPVHLRFDIHGKTVTYYCRKDIKEHKNVGVCKYYEDFNQ